MTNIVTFSRLGTYGRFANQLFQISGTIGIARKNGFDFAFPAWRNYDALNFGQSDLDVQARFENPLPLYSGPDLPEHGVAFGYHDVRLTNSVSLLGHFQSERYFEHCRDEVAFYFKMKQEAAVSDYCGIHWRAGDYGAAPTKYKPQGNAFHPRMALDYYEPAMSIFPSNQKFLVFSDDLDAAEEMFGDRVEYSRETDYLDDFRVLKTCRHFIISNSSFSLMAAILGEGDDKQVVCPEPWFGSAYYGQLDEKDIASRGWHIVNWEKGTSEIKRAA
jgi:Glycosyl transferase family 11